MKRALVLVPLFLAAVLFPTPVHAGGGPASVTFVNAITYDAENDFPLSLCLDGELLVSLLSTGDFYGPIDLAAGDYLVEFVQAEDCEGTAFASDTITIDPSAEVTVMGWWGTDGREISVLADETECLEPGTSRIVLRHGASTGPIDLTITPEGGAPDEVLSAVEPGGQGVVDVAAGPYEDGVVSDAATEVEIVALGSEDLGEGELRVLYLYGGADGDIGVFLAPVVDLDLCVEPPSSSSSTTAAVSAETRPTFTG